MIGVGCYDSVRQRLRRASIGIVVSEANDRTSLRDLCQTVGVVPRVGNLALHRYSHRRTPTRSVISVIDRSQRGSLAIDEHPQFFADHFERPASDVPLALQAPLATPAVARGLISADDPSRHIRC